MFPKEVIFTQYNYRTILLLISNVCNNVVAASLVDNVQVVASKVD